ncbi:MAG: tetraacyldisaccharide 4'-kinase [Ignavibacteriae bacterium]|nr:tetraacyldisaccharide 4'-kinase [Ignavibacteria bacterium]MBI3363638.1 tetraacyldisaccharide 4'-kinase [Ignavibacteriota bacterium]
MNVRRVILLPFSWLYGIVVLLRNWFYDKGIFKIEQMEVPVISVGNITTGGTGKTPFVEYLAHYLSLKGVQVAIISRGYKRSSRGTQIVSDGKTIRDTAAIFGDEPFQMAKKLTGAVVIVDGDRARGARYVINRFRVDVILLDDGFQHRKIHREVDIVLIDSTCDVQEVRLLPAGLRREPLSSLRRATLVAITRVESTVPDWASSLKQYTSAPMLALRFQLKHFCHVDSIQRLGIEEVKGKRCVAFCGIGNPASFRKMLEELGLEVVDFFPYADHHQYTIEDFRELSSRFEQRKADMIVTTEKDMCRLSSSPLPDFFQTQSCYFLEIETTIIRGEEILHAIIDRTVLKAA